MVHDIQELLKITKDLDASGVIMMAIGWILKSAYAKTVQAIGGISHKLDLLLKYFNIKDDS